MNIDRVDKNVRRLYLFIAASGDRELESFVFIESIIPVGYLKFLHCT